MTALEEKREPTKGNKWTPLHCTATMRHADVVSLLVDNGASVNMKDVYGRSPLEQAIDENRPGVVCHFIKTVGMDPTPYDQWTQQRIEKLLEEASRSYPTRSPDPQQEMMSSLVITDKFEYLNC